jgi:hypothetical protein
LCDARTRVTGVAARTVSIASADSKADGRGALRHLRACIRETRRLSVVALCCSLAATLAISGARLCAHAANAEPSFAISIRGARRQPVGLPFDLGCRFGLASTAERTDRYPKPPLPLASPRSAHGFNAIVGDSALLVPKTAHPQGNPDLQLMKCDLRLTDRMCPLTLVRTRLSCKSQFE